MTITDKRKQLSFTVLGYEYPLCKGSTAKNYNYDANWLTVKVNFKQADVELENKDSCLTTGELKTLVEEMDHILEGSSTCYITENMEPYIKIGISVMEDHYVILFQHDLYDDKGDWSSWSGAEMMDRQRFAEIRDELAGFCEQYPER